MKELSESELAEIVAKNPELYYRGVIALGSFNSRIPFFKKLKPILLDLIGEQRAILIENVVLQELKEKGLAF